MVPVKAVADLLKQQVSMNIFNKSHTLRSETHKLGFFCDAICDTLLEALQVLGNVPLILQKHGEASICFDQ